MSLPLLAATFPLCRQQTLEPRPKTLPQAPLIDADNHGKEWVCQQEMGRLQDIYNLLRLAAVEIIHKEHDTID